MAIDDYLKTGFIDTEKTQTEQPPSLDVMYSKMGLEGLAPQTRQDQRIAYIPQGIGFEPSFVPYQIEQLNKQTPPPYYGPRTPGAQGSASNYGLVRDVRAIGRGILDSIGVGMQAQIDTADALSAGQGTLSNRSIGYITGNKPLAKTAIEPKGLAAAYQNAASKSDVFAKPVMQETEQEDLNRYTEMMAAPTPGPAERESIWDISIPDILSTATSDLKARKERAKGATLIGSDRQSMIMSVLVKQTEKSWNELTPKERGDISGWARQIARAERLGITVDPTAYKDIPSAVKFIESRIEEIERDASMLGVDLGDVANAKRDLAQQTGKSVFEISDKDASQHAQFTRLENTYAEKVGTTDKYELRRIVEDEISSASRSSKKGEDFRISRKAREASDFLAFLQAKESPDVDKELLSGRIGKSSGFSKSMIDEYLKSRKDAMESRKGMLDIEIKAQQLIDARNANEIFHENAAIDRQGNIASVQISQAEAATARERSRALRAVSDFALSSKQASDVIVDIQTELAKKGTGKNGPNIAALGEKYRRMGASAFSVYEKGLSIYYEFLRTGGNK